MKKETKFPGVYSRNSETRRHQGKIDKCYYITYRDGNRKVWEKIGWTSEGYSPQMAANIRAERMRTIRHGEELPKKKMQVTFEDLWKHYDSWLETGKKHPSDDRSRYKKHLKKRFGNRRLSSITPLELDELKAELLLGGLSPATVKHVLVLIRQMINKAINWGLWHGENPIKKIKLPKLSNNRERYLTHEQAQKILEEVKKTSTQFYEICLMSLCTGMRAGEIFDLKWAHVDFQNDIIHVADPKGGTPRKAYMTEIIKKFMNDRDKGEPEDCVFKSRKGERIKQVSNSFDRAVNNLKLNDGIDDPRQKVCFHTLRHTFASWLALNGTPILTIKELLGHKSLIMTERYSHLSPDHKKQAAEQVDRIIQTQLNGHDTEESN